MPATGTSEWRSRGDARLVDAVVEALNRDPLDVLAYFEPGAELHFRLDGSSAPARGRFHGHEPITEALCAIRASFEPVTAELLDVAEVARGCVVASIRHRGRGRASGARCRTDLFHAARLETGLVRRWEVFFDEAAALSAALATDTTAGAHGTAGGA